MQAGRHLPKDFHSLSGLIVKITIECKAGRAQPQPAFFMASIFKKRSKKKNQPWWIQYTDHLGNRKTVKGFTDKRRTQELAAKRETEARLRKNGLVDAEQERITEVGRTPIEEHLPAFEESLANKDPRYVSGTLSKIRTIIAGCGFSSLADIQREAVETYLRQRRKEKERFGPSTYNMYVQAMGSFCKWCDNTKRLPSSPLKGIKRLNIEVDIRHKRRALTPAEVGRWLEAAETSKESVEDFDGKQRARIYLVAYMTGLRKNEIANLSPRSFALDQQPPTVTVEAEHSKHRSKDVLPLHADLVAKLRAWIAGMAPNGRLFPGFGSKNAALMVRYDLANAGIPYHNDDGFADFHAVRHTYITQLFRSGALLPEVKELARHRNIQTTMKYTHIGMADRARALSNLPVPK